MNRHYQLAMEAQITLIEELPTISEFIELRESVGWGKVTEDTASKSIEGAILTICLRDNGKLIGLGRIVCDGVLYFYISKFSLESTN